MKLSSTWLFRPRRISIYSGEDKSFVWVSGRSFAISVLSIAGFGAWVVFASSLAIIEMLGLSDRHGPRLHDGAERLEHSHASHAAASDDLATLDTQLARAVATLQERDSELAHLLARRAELTVDGTLDGAGPSIDDDAKHPKEIAPEHLVAALETSLANLRQAHASIAALEGNNEELEGELALVSERTERVIFRILDSVELANQGMSGVFRGIGVNPEALAEDVKATYLGSGGPETAVLPSGSSGLGSDVVRAGVTKLDAALRDLHAFRIAYLGMPFGFPVDGAVRKTSSFGYRTHPVSGRYQHHQGVDFAARTGTPIIASGNGKVEFAATKGGYGKMITLKHVGGVRSRYAHLSSIKVSPGEKVSRGQIIGYMGSTGISTGPHLHFEVHVRGEAVDPGPFMRAE